MHPVQVEVGRAGVHALAEHMPSRARRRADERAVRRKSRGHIVQQVGEVDSQPVTWANAQGTRRSFGVQAAICFAAYLIILVMQAYGGRMRAWAGPLKFKTS